MPGVLRRIFQTCGDSLKKVWIGGANDQSHSDDDPPFLLTWGWVTLPSVNNFTWYADAVARALLRRLSLPQAQTLKLQDVPCDVAHSLTSSTAKLTSGFLLNADGEMPEHTSINSLSDLSSLQLIRPLGLLGCISTPHLNTLTLVNDHPAQ
ncbi:hypothetical protein BOTBODRAFT_224863 [Botryobasidium botryosum FD-172 SS1]|uniref:Uncharacterized protein n=1 Tax=Botryobasidium botryosum (strain FD-172 SS1) TaxID=930990 RepID=A0A067MQV9_BOTB1|nr:hypothetical protein BOTBODRAFT_224863 [Botryobasidium botryosum FD-172 SS1]